MESLLLKEDADQILKEDGDALLIEPYVTAAASKSLIFTRSKSISKPSYPFVLNKGDSQAKGLIAWWPGGPSGASKLFDLSGKNRHGTLTGFNFTSSSGWVLGNNGGNALIFDGSNDYVNHGNVLDFEKTNAFSISTWVKLTTASPANAGTVISKVLNGGNFEGYQFGIRGDQANDPVELELRADDATFLSIRCNNVWTTKWTNLIVTYDGSQTVGGMKVYINGILLTVSSSTNTLAGTLTNSGSFEIGVIANTISPFLGSIEEVSVYNYALTQSEVFKKFDPPTRWALRYQPGIQRYFLPLQLETIDSSSNGGYTAASSTDTWSHTNYGNYLLVGVAMLGVQNVTSVTYNGDALSLVGAATSAGSLLRTELWGMVAPDQGTYDVTVTLDGSIAWTGIATSWFNVHQTTPTEGFNSATATNVGAADATVDITSTVDYGMVVDLLATSDGSVTVGAGQTQRANVTGAAGSGCMSNEGTIHPAGATTMSWTGIGAAQTWVIEGIVLRPLGASNPITHAGVASIYSNILLQAMGVGDFGGTCSISSNYYLASSVNHTLSILSQIYANAILNSTGSNLLGGNSQLNTNFDVLSNLVVSMASAVDILCQAQMTPQASLEAVCQTIISSACNLNSSAGLDSLILASILCNALCTAVGGQALLCDSTIVSNYDLFALANMLLSGNSASLSNVYTNVSVAQLHDALSKCIIEANINSQASLSLSGISQVICESLTNIIGGREQVVSAAINSEFNVYSLLNNILSAISNINIDADLNATMSAILNTISTIIAKNDLSINAILSLSGLCQLLTSSLVNIEGKGEFGAGSFINSEFNLYSLLSATLSIASNINTNSDLIITANALLNAISNITSNSYLSSSALLSLSGICQLLAQALTNVDGTTAAIIEAQSNILTQALLNAAANLLIECNTKINTQYNTNTATSLLANAISTISSNASLSSIVSKDSNVAAIIITDTDLNVFGINSLAANSQINSNILINNTAILSADATAKILTQAFVDQTLNATKVASISINNQANVNALAGFNFDVSCPILSSLYANAIITVDRNGQVSINSDAQLSASLSASLGSRCIILVDSLFNAILDQVSSQEAAEIINLILYVKNQLNLTQYVELQRLINTYIKTTKEFSLER